MLQMPITPRPTMRFARRTRTTWGRARGVLPPNRSELRPTVRKLLKFNLRFSGSVKGTKKQGVCKVLQMPITPEITAREGPRSHRAASGGCPTGPPLGESPAPREQGVSETESRLPEKTVCRDYPLRPSVLAPNCNLATFRFGRSWLPGVLADLRERTWDAWATLSRVRGGIPRPDRSSIRGATGRFPPESQSPNASLWEKS